MPVEAGVGWVECACGYECGSVGQCDMCVFGCDGLVVGQCAGDFGVGVGYCECLPAFVDDVECEAYVLEHVGVGVVGVVVWEVDVGCGAWVGEG